jgi:hypothetical protein
MLNKCQNGIKWNHNEDPAGKYKCKNLIPSSFRRPNLWQQGWTGRKDQQIVERQPQNVVNQKQGQLGQRKFCL